MKRGVLLAVLPLLLMVSGTTSAEKNIWIDEKGVVHSEVKENSGSEGPKVELYVTSWCPYCRQAKEFLRSRGIPFTAYDIEKDESAARRKSRLDGRGGVPFAVINGQKIHGFSPQAYEKALGGY